MFGIYRDRIYYSIIHARAFLSHDYYLFVYQRSHVPAQEPCDCYSDKACVIVNFKCQFYWVTGSPDICLNIILGVFISDGVFI
jgi:hypothetical protein